MDMDYSCNNEEKAGASAFQKERSKYTYIQEAFVEVETEDKPVLEFGKIYSANLLSVGTGITPKSNRRTIDFTYSVYGTSYPTTVVDFYVVYDNDKKELKHTIRRLRQTLEIYNLKLNITDLESIETIVSACQCLIGSKVKIKKKNKYAYDRYKVISVED